LPAAGAFAAALVAALWPPRRRQAAGARSLDVAMPAWDFGEAHHVRIRATPMAVDRAARAVTAADIRLFRALMWIRALGGVGRAAARRPLLEVFVASGFTWLADHPGRELALGAVGAFWTRRGRLVEAPADAAAFSTFDPPGLARTGFDFRFEPDGDGCRLS